MAGRETANWLGEKPTVGGTLGSGDPAIAEIKVDLPATKKNENPEKTEQECEGLRIKSFGQAQETLQ